jgi:hypothetical protein
MHFSVPAISRGVPVLLESQIFKEVSSNSGVEMSSIFLPHQFVLEFLTVSVRGILDRCPDLFERQKVVAKIGRKDCGASFVAG